MSRYFPDLQSLPHQEIFAGVTIQTAAADKMMLSYVTLQPGSTVEKHSHPHEQVGILVQGEATFFVGEETRKLKPGDMYRIPGGVEHKVEVGDQLTIALDIFSPIREDYLLEEIDPVEV